VSIQSAMNEPLGISALTKSVWHDFLRARRALFIFEVLFKLLEAWLFVPAVAIVLAIVLAGAGHVAVSNWDILDFLLSPLGLLYAALFGTIAAALLLLEQAGIMVIAALGCSPERPHVKHMLLAVFRKTWRVAQLGAVKAVLLALTFLPFVLLALLTHALFLSQHDIYFYLTDRPPAFWLAAGVGGVIVLAASVIGMVLYVRWAFALPILLFENQPARAALRASRERVRGAAWRIGFVIIGWRVVVLLLSAALLAAFRFAAVAVLERTEESRLALVVLLVAHGGLLATASFATVVGQGLIARRLYLIRSEQVGVSRPEGLETALGSGSPIPPWSWRLACLTMPLFLLAPLAVWIGLPQYVEAGEQVKVTAHRGHSRAAPENTLSAIRKAIESGADYAEIDVQMTSDGVVLLLHDRDLKRVAGDSRRLGDLTFEEVRKLEVGSWFDPSFAGERIPTLAEAIELARGRIKLNIEMKFFGPDPRLAPEVARLLREKDFEADCIITSFELEALDEVKKINPRQRTGLIVAHVLGDVNRLGIDALSVRQEALSDEMLRDAHRRGREVHVWTVNEPREMTRLMMRGVDNIITSDPDLMIRVRGEWKSLTGTERLLLSSRLLLGLNP
jgi:glycerophosphoryl diester phosphodiesterase